MSEPSSALMQLLKRLEGATSRLEDLALTKSKTTTSQSVPTSPSVKKEVVELTSSPEAASNESGSTSIVTGYDQLVIPAVEKYLLLSEDVGDVVFEQSKIVRELLITHQRHYLEVASSQQKPVDKEKIAKLFQPSQVALDGLLKHVEINRQSPLFNHLSTIASGIPAASWVLVETDTASCVKELLESAQFYAARVTQAFKSGDPTHVDWANAVVEVFEKLHEYVCKYHSKGLAWNTKGTDFNEGSETNDGRPVKVGSLAGKTDLVGSSEGADSGRSISGISGSSVSSALKKSDKPSPRFPSSDITGDSVVVPPMKSTARSASKSTKDGETVLEGFKWLVQNYTGNSVVVEPTSSKQTITISNCQSASVQIKGRCAGVTIDTSRKTKVTLETATSSVEAVNCQSCQLVILHATTKVIIDKSDGLQLYLSKDGLNVEVFSYKSSQVTLHATDPQATDPSISEQPIPDHFKTTIVRGKAVTVPVDSFLT